MIKIMWLSDYEDMVNYQVEILKENAELRKVCWCKDCQHHGTLITNNGVYAGDRCKNKDSDNYMELMNPYGSCEKCERR